MQTNRNTEGCAVSRVKHRHSNSVTTFQHALINKLIIYITMNKHIALIYTLSRSKHQNTANLSLQTYKKNQWICFTVPHGLDYNSRTYFANLGSFAKLSVPVEPTIP